jgi:hypothetical protein
MSGMLALALRCTLPSRRLRARRRLAEQAGVFEPGGNAEKLNAIADGLPDWVPPPEGEQLPPDAGKDEAKPRTDWRFIQDHKIVAPRELVKGTLPYTGIAFIGGQSGAGKTFIAIDLAVALALGIIC